MRYASQRDYLQIAQGVLAVLALVAYVAIVQPRLISTGAGFISSRPDRRARPLRPADGSLLGGARFLVRLLYERPLRGFRPPRTRARC